MLEAEHNTYSVGMKNSYYITSKRTHILVLSVEEKNFNAKLKSTDINYTWGLKN
jgi:hypothetical protein